MLNNQAGNTLLLNNEESFSVQPSVVRVLGLRGALVLQGIQDELLQQGKIINDRRWIEGPLENWYAKFDFLSSWTVKRIFQELERKGVLLSDNPNRTKMDRTKWYTINYEKLGSLLFINQGASHVNRDHGEYTGRKGATL